MKALRALPRGRVGLKQSRTRLGRIKQGKLGQGMEQGARLKQGMEQGRLGQGARLARGLSLRPLLLATLLALLLTNANALDAKLDANMKAAKHYMDIIGESLLYGNLENIDGIIGDFHNSMNSIRFENFNSYLVGNQKKLIYVLNDNLQKIMQSIALIKRYSKNRDVINAARAYNAVNMQCIRCHNILRATFSVRVNDTFKQLQNNSTMH